MKRKICTVLCFLIAVSMFGFNAKKATVENMYSEVERKLGHKMEAMEKTVVNSTYFYYKNKCEDGWSKDAWDAAVEKSVNVCQSKAFKTAAKAGNVGEKLIQSLIVSTEDGLQSAGKWIDKQSKEYEKRHK